jgi:protein TonB
MRLFGLVAARAIVSAAGGFITLRRVVVAPIVLAVASLLPAQDFYEVQLRAGKAALSAGRPADAADDLRIAAFGFLEKPALLCEALAHLALAQQAAGRTPLADAALARFAEVERAFPACREARLEAAGRAEFEALVRRRLPGPLAEEILAPPTRPSPAATRRSTAAPPPASPTPTIVATATPGRTSNPVPIATPTARPAASRPEPASPLARTATPVRPSVLASVATPTSSPAAARPDPAASTISISDDLDRQPQLKTTTRPAYPAAAQRSGIGGIVLLRVLVSEKGEPLRVEVARGVQPDLDNAAVAAVRQWLFEPGRKGGASVAAWMTVAVPFEARRR